MSREKWEQLGCKITRNGHRLFLETSSGRVAIADNSGVTPDKTEDGVLYVDNREPIKAYECDGHTSYTIPLLTPGGETTHTGTDFRGAMRVCQECGNKLKIPEDIRALFMAVIQGRIVLCE